jgi:hypothetical protein
MSSIDLRNRYCLKLFGLAIQGEHSISACNSGSKYRSRTQKVGCALCCSLTAWCVCNMHHEVQHANCHWSFRTQPVFYPMQGVRLTPATSSQSIRRTRLQISSFPFSPFIRLLHPSLCPHKQTSQPRNPRQPSLENSLILLNCLYTSAPNLNLIPLPNITNTLAIPLNSSSWPILPASPYGLSLSCFDSWCKHFMVVITTSSKEEMDSLFRRDWKAVVDLWRQDGSESSGRIPVDLKVYGQF